MCSNSPGTVYSFQLLLLVLYPPCFSYGYMDTILLVFLPPYWIFPSVFTPGTISTLFFILSYGFYSAGIFSSLLCACTKHYLAWGDLILHLLRNGLPCTLSSHWCFFLSNAYGHYPPNLGFYLKLHWYAVRSLGNFGREYMGTLFPHSVSVSKIVRRIIPQYWFTFQSTQGHDLPV